MDNRNRRFGDAPDDDAPFALVVEGSRGFLLVALNAAARGARLRVGQRLTDARAICPELLVEPADPAGDAATLERMALWAQRWSPWTAVDATGVHGPGLHETSETGSGGLLVDVTGAAHLFGGEADLLGDMARRLRADGFRTRIAMSPTVGASWALARYGPRARSDVDGDDLAARLDPLPVRSLRLEPRAVLLLERLGLKTVGQLCAVPRLALARRFATEAVTANPLIRLDQALGRVDEPVAPALPALPVRIMRRVTEPIVDMALLEHLMTGMAGDLCAMLERRALGARRVRLDAFRTDGRVESVSAETARPSRAPDHLLRLFQGKLERLDAGFGFDAAVLTATLHEPLDAAQSHLLDHEDGDALLARLIDRLGAKLGADRVRRPAPVQSHVPERSVRWMAALEPAAAEDFRSPAKRPIRLLDRPERIDVLYATPEGAPRRFTWRKRAHLIAKTEGPERIAPEWWRARAGARERDYYRVEDEEGRRYWLFRHGRFGDGHDGEPGWYLHGLFA